MMKIVKLDRRHRALSEGFTHALRFERYDHIKIKPIETVLENTYGHRGWTCREAKTWYSMFGNMARRDCDGQMYKTFWIYFRDESDITLLALLGVI